MKLITILANFLTTNLMDFDEKQTRVFVSRLVSYLDNFNNNKNTSSYQELAHLEIRGLIPLPSEEANDEIESLVIPYGFALLQEITFNFLVYCAADV